MEALEANIVVHTLQGTDKPIDFVFGPEIQSLYISGTTLPLYRIHEFMPIVISQWSFDKVRGNHLQGDQVKALSDILSANSSLTQLNISCTSMLFLRKIYGMFE